MNSASIYGAGGKKRLSVIANIWFLVIVQVTRYIQHKF